MHALAHPHVGDAHFAHGAIHIADEGFVQCLGELRGLLGLLAELCLQPLQDQKHMHDDHLEAAGDGIGHAMAHIEHRQSRLRHNGVVEPLGREVSIFAA